MASISLPRVLTQRRGPVEVERENFEKAQSQSITKAINNQENPVKEKHVRSAIIGTYHEKGSTTFWGVVGTLPVKGNPIVCWKFSHTLHKLLREGHPNVIPESIQYKGKLIDLGKYWSLLRDSYGKLNSNYCKLLATKLDFHAKNPKFPGNLALTDEQLESIGEMDINNFFQISVEMFDYMDEILSLQGSIFGCLETGRSNSMTSSGQCRLAPLIPCIQDSSHLYDYLVKLLFRLHASLPPDVLIGHRDRFYKQFKVLRDFYKKSSVLQYFKHLIQIPLLPEEPPNFLIGTELSFHVSPVVILPPHEDIPDNDSVQDAHVVDSSPLLDFEPTNGSSHEDLLFEKEQLIERLRREIEELRREIHRIKAEDHQIIEELRHNLAAMENRLTSLMHDLQSKHVENEKLQTKAKDCEENAEAAAKLVEIEKRAKANDEKFQKMKDVYNKLREEHITLIRNKADVEKQLSTIKQTTDGVEKDKSELEELLSKVMSEKQEIEQTMLEQNEEQQQQIASLFEANSLLDSKKTELEEQLHLSVTEKENTEKSLSATVEKSEDLLNQIQMEKSVVETEKLALAEALSIALNKQQDLERTHEEHRESAAKQLEEMTRDKEELINNERTLESKLATESQEKAVVQQTLQQKSEEFDILMSQQKNEQNSLQNKILTLEESLEKSTTEKLQTEQNLHQTTESFSQEVAKLQHDNKSLSNKIKELESQLSNEGEAKLAVEDSLRQVTERLTLDCKGLSVEKQILITNISDLEVKLANVLDERQKIETRLHENSEANAQQQANLNREKELLQVNVVGLENKISKLDSENSLLGEEVKKLKGIITSLETNIQTSQQQSLAEQQKMAKDSKEAKFSLLVSCIEEAENIVQAALKEIDNPATGPLSCTPDYLLALSDPLRQTLARLQQCNNNFTEKEEELEGLLKSVTAFSHFLGQFIIHGRGTANASPDIDQGDHLLDACRTSGQDTLVLLASMKTKGSDSSVSLAKVRADIMAVTEITEAMIKKLAGTVEEKIGDLVEQELTEMDRAIEEAAARIEEILRKSRQAESGVKLEVSEKILDACTSLMQSIKILVQRSKVLQLEIVAQGKGSASAKEFYKRNHQWTEGLLSAAKAVGIGAKFLVDAADKVVSGKAKFEVLMAASQEIAASTAQLVVASKVKADPGSQNLRNLSQASKGVTGNTGNVVATVKNCAQMLEDSDVMDFTKLTLHQAKRLEMESQVRVLELENGLEKERVKLSALRKTHYSLAGPGEGWDEEKSNQK